MLPALASEEYVWRADAFCANLDPDDEMYCLCSRGYDIELPTISGGNSIDERVYVSGLKCGTENKSKAIWR